MSSDFCKPDDNDVKREVKQVIIIRRDLKMRRGKEIAQGSHASMRFLTMRIRQCNESKPNSNWAVVVLAIFFPALAFLLFGMVAGTLNSIVAVCLVANIIRTRIKSCKLKFSDAERSWINGTFSKITLQVQTEAEMLAIAEKAKAAGLETHVICDTGKTEFNGVPTNTCMAIGPDYADNIDPFTKHLSLY